MLEKAPPSQSARIPSGERERPREQAIPVPLDTVQHSPLPYFGSFIGAYRTGSLDQGE